MKDLGTHTDSIYQKTRARQGSKTRGRFLLS